MSNQIKSIEDSNIEDTLSSDCVSAKQRSKSSWIIKSFVEFSWKLGAYINIKEI
jgi:hypothetical protein